MKRIAVTGATSMIGSELVKAAVRENVQVFALVREDTDRLGRLPESPLVQIIRCDMDNMSNLRDVPKDCDCFYHLAWAGTGKATRDDPVRHAPNIGYTLAAVETAQKMGCRRFIGAGSQAEYGPVEGRINDHTRFFPVTAYGAAKLAASVLSKKRCDQLGLEHVWGRIFSVYGPYDKDGTMITSSVEAFLSGKMVHFSAASQKWNYLFEADAGEMFFRLGDPSVPSDHYLIAHVESRTLKEYIDTVIQQFGSEVKYEYSHSAEHLAGLDVDVSKTVEATGFIPCVSFEEGIRQTIAYRRLKHESR